MTSQLRAIVAPTEEQALLFHIMFILGYSLWWNRYASDPRVLGRTIRVNGVPSVVIGVMPDGFSFPTRSRLWQPLALLPRHIAYARDAVSDQSRQDPFEQPGMVFDPAQCETFGARIDVESGPLPAWWWR